MADILSQEEINALLDVIDEDVTNINDMVEQKNIRLYDFKRPNRVSKEQLRIIRHINDKFVRNLKSELSPLLDNDIEIQLHSVDQMTYGEFLMSLPNPTSFNVFSLGTLPEKCILEINLQILKPLIDNLLGCKISNLEGNLSLTNIEMKLSNIILDEIMYSLRYGWKDLVDVYPKIENNYLSPNEDFILPTDEIVVMGVFEIIIGNNSSMMNICYPVITLEPILDKLLTNNLIETEVETDNSIINKIEVDVYEDILLGDISLKDLKNIKNKIFYGNEIVINVGIKDILTNKGKE